MHFSSTFSTIFFLFFQERRRARTLLRLHNLYSRRVPEAELADARLGELLEQFSKNAGTNAKIDEIFPEFLKEVQQVQELCGRITASSPAVGTGTSADVHNVPGASKSTISTAEYANSGSFVTSLVDSFERDKATAALEAAVLEANVLSQVKHS